MRFLAISRIARVVPIGVLGAKGQAYLAAHGVETGGHKKDAPRKLNLKPQESWVDLHREYADILDGASLQ